MMPYNDHNPDCALWHGGNRCTCGYDKPRASALADAIVTALFHNGSGDTARRLVLELADGSDGGGWSFEGAFWAVMGVLDAETLLVKDAESMPTGSPSRIIPLASAIPGDGHGIERAEKGQDE
jgi:hypothetical protein